MNKIIEDLAEIARVTYLNPFGLQLSPHKTSASFIEDISGKQLRDLVKKFRFVLLRGFTEVDKEDLVNYATTLGPLLEWEFGNVMEMRVHEQPKNYLFTNGAVPFHWDGAFHQVPRYLLFHCIEAPLQSAGGETLFSETTEIWRNASETEKHEWMRHSLSYKTEKLAHYGGCIKERLVQEHLDTQEIILRFAEPIPTTMLNPVEVRVDNVDENQSTALIQQIIRKCYLPTNCYQHAWQQHDFLIADNYALIHGRHAFKQFSPRHLRRIQIL